MDKLFLRQLAVPALIGVNDHEKATPQIIFLDIEAPINAALAACTDEVNATINYAEIYHCVNEFIAATRFQLLETLAEKLSAHLLKKFSLKWVRIGITKKPSDMPDVAGAGVEIERHV